MQKSNHNSWQAKCIFGGYKQGKGKKLMMTTIISLSSVYSYKVDFKVLSNPLPPSSNPRETEREREKKILI